LWFTSICHAQQAVSDLSEQARDFAYTLASGEEERMYSLSAEVLLICFYDPSCEDCHAMMKRLAAAPAVKRLTGEKRLVALAVYPEEDVQLWEENRSHVPSGWINGYDPGARIILDDLYDFTGLPAVYLLDGQKRFLLKEATVEAVERVLKARFNIQDSKFEIQDSGLQDGCEG
jgi:hypothetical protein